MKRLLSIVLLFLLCMPVYSATYVRGHFRSDGAYVPPHYRSHADGHRFNNYSGYKTTNSYKTKKYRKNTMYKPVHKQHQEEEYGRNTNRQTIQTF